MIIPDLGTSQESSLSVADALFPRTRQRVLALLFGRPDQRFYVSEIARRAGGAVGQVQRELERLTNSGLILREPEAKEVYFRANTRSSIYHELVALTAKTFGIADLLRDALAPLHERIDIAFIYGSVARGEQRATSDVDVLVVGSILLSDLDPALTRAEAALGRAISPTLLDRKSLRRLVEDQDHFIKSVLAGPKIFLVGDPAKLKSLHEARAR